MAHFFDDYFNISKMIKSKREYRQEMARVKSLPEDYQYVFKEIDREILTEAIAETCDAMLNPPAKLLGINGILKKYLYQSLQKSPTRP